MRILQIIDSLDIGGAEKMAVNYANALSQRIEFSGIVVTRKEGELKNQLNEKVYYLFLNRKKIFDLKALLIFRRYIKCNKIEIIHAHGMSVFIAVIIKIIYFRVKVIWHDHNGARFNQRLIQNKLILFCSFFLSGIIVVNHKLRNWVKDMLSFENVIYLPNFILNNNNRDEITILKGTINKKILCLANLRNPKNHNLLIDVAIIIKDKFPEWTFHLVGKDYNDDYSSVLKNRIKENTLEKNVFIYGLKDDIENIIMQSTICILTSDSEGLPVALLEYGLHKKATITTDVGEIPLIIENGINGFITPVKDTNLFCSTLVKLILNPDLRVSFGQNLYETILKNNSEKTIIDQYIKWLKCEKC